MLQALTGGTSQEMIRSMELLPSGGMNASLLDELGLTGVLFYEAPQFGLFFVLSFLLCFSTLLGYIEGVLAEVEQRDFNFPNCEIIKNLFLIKY